MPVISTMIHSNGYYNLFPQRHGFGYKSCGNEVTAPTGYFKRPDMDFTIPLKPGCAEKLEWVEATLEDAPVEYLDGMPRVNSRDQKKPTELIRQVFEEINPFQGELNGMFFIEVRKYQRTRGGKWEIGTSRYGFRAFDRPTMAMFKLCKPDIESLVANLMA